MALEEQAMTVPVLIEQTGGDFCASLVGSPELRAVRPSRDEAIEALRSELAKKLASGELLDLEVQPLGVSGLAGIFRDDASLTEIRDDIYRQRDAEQPQ
jgi:hypothetical protein